jgi:hypothetical protein
MALSIRLKIIWLLSFALLVTASITSGMSWIKVYGIDIMFHISIYALLSCLSVLIFQGRKAVFPTFFAMASAALFFEIMHGMITGCGFEPFDAAFNNLGIVIGVAAAIFVRPLLEKVDH